MADYGKALRTIRAARDVTQHELAERVGISGSYVSLIEAGERVPSLDVIDRCAKELDAPVFLLMLLAADKGDLRGLPAAAVDQLGGQLLRSLIGGRRG